MEYKRSVPEMPGRSRRRLNVSSPPKLQKNVSSPSKKQLDSVSFEVAPSTSSNMSELFPSSTLYDGRGVSNLDRRLTRSASKRWLKAYESSVPMVHSVVPVTASSGMLPPPQPVVALSRPSTSGMLTRLRYRSRGISRASTVDANKISQSFFKRLSFDQVSNTSDYGTASEHSRKCSVASGGMSPLSDSGNSCHCTSISGVESLGTSSGEDEFQPHPIDMDWAEQLWVNKDTVQQRPHVTVHRVKDVTAFIPDKNRSDFKGVFKVSIRSDANEDAMYRPPICSSLRVHHISPVISMEPHGVQFHEDLSVMLVIPLSIEPSDEEWISCLYSNTEGGCQPRWERLPRKDYTYRNGSVVITTNHFSLFTVILEEPYPEIMKTIRRRIGGRLLLSEVPGIEVEFPHGSLDQDLDAYLRVLYNYEPMLNSGGERADTHGALASPVIMLGPHGHAFSTSRKPVRIKLPIPHYHEIRARFGSNVGLTVWQSSTTEGEPTCWQRLESSHLQLETPVLGVVVVSFAVHHFSFFKVVWDLLSSSLTEAKMGMSYFYPYISFSMMCQAFMEESKECRFGLEVICYRSDKILPEQTNYRHRVGASTKPKLVRPGRVLVRLKSQMFEADIEAGEDAAMSKEEPDFRGRDFEKQYACRFKQNVSVECGTFGKVIVERILPTGKNDPLFEFNLNKSDAGHELLQPMGSERWTAFAMKELASTLQITEGNNWKRFAQQIGFTKSEIKSKFQYSPDPFLAIMYKYGSRGGTPEEFMQSLYAVSRDLNLNNGISGSLSDVGSSSHSSNGSKGSGSRDSGSRHSRGSGNRFGGLWGYRPWAQVNNDSDSDSMPADAKEGSRKRSHPSLEKKNSGGGGSSAKRRKFSDVSETVSSGSERGDDENSDEEAEKSNNKHIKNKRRLSDKDMWRISTGIARKDWRFLGRTLGIEERVLMDLEHQYQPVGFRECAYQMLLEWKGRKPRKCTFGNLYSALLRENMVEIAKHMVKILPDGEEEARERDFND